MKTAPYVPKSENKSASHINHTTCSERNKHALLCEYIQVFASRQKYRNLFKLHLVQIYKFQWIQNRKSNLDKYNLDGLIIHMAD